MKIHEIGPKEIIIVKDEDVVFCRGCKRQIKESAYEIRNYGVYCLDGDFNCFIQKVAELFDHIGFEFRIKSKIYRISALKKQLLMKKTIKKI